MNETVEVEIDGCMIQVIPQEEIPGLIVRLVDPVTHETVGLCGVDWLARKAVTVADEAL